MRFDYHKSPFIQWAIQFVPVVHQQLIKNDTANFFYPKYDNRRAFLFRKRKKFPKVQIMSKHNFLVFKSKL